MIDYNISSITLQQIQIFVSVAETLNFSKSALELNLSQPGISKSIATIENILGFPLFQRTSRKVLLTKEGLILYQKWSPLLKQAQAGYIEALNEKNSNLSSINIGITNTTDSRKYFWNIANKFQQEYPDVKLDVESKDMKLLYQNLIDGIFDVIFLPDFEKYDLNTSQFDWKYAAIDAVQIIVPNNHPLYNHTELTLSEIAEYPIIALHPDTNPNFLKSIEKLYNTIGQTPMIGKIYRSNFKLEFSQMKENTIHITDNFWMYHEGEYSKKIPLRGYANGIICVWNKCTEKKYVKKFVDQFPFQNTSSVIREGDDILFT